MRGVLNMILGLLITAAYAEDLVITSFSRNGEVAWTYPTNGVMEYRIEWSSELSQGLWCDVECGLRGIAPTGTTMVVGVPMFYRVKALRPPPAAMVYVPAGFFTMGNAMDVAEGYANELPLHRVHVNGFFMDRHEVAEDLWNAVYTWATNNGYSFSNSGSGKASDHPVNTVNWYDCVKWANARSQMNSFTPCYTNATGIYVAGEAAPGCDWDANGYRLPTEAEWEKAARGGVSGYRFPFADNTIQHGRANYEASNTYAYDLSSPGYHPDYQAGGQPYTSPVGSFSANGYGLYDMAGNVDEWCWDFLGVDYYGVSPVSDPRGPVTGTYRSKRGGGWYDAAVYQRTAHRSSWLPQNEHYALGFRTVLSSDAYDGIPPDTTPPSTVSSFTATPGNSQVALSWTNPGDADFEGVIIQRATGDYPATPTDGSNVYNGTGTGTTDTGLINGTPYYYKAFSYDEVPNYSSGATATATPSAALDATPPANISSFLATAGDGQVSLSWSNPGDADLQGVKIQRKTGSYPSSPTDGSTVYNGTGTGTTDTGLSNGTQYYYKAFSYDEVPNYSSGATATATPQSSVPAGMVLIPAGSFQMGDNFSEGDSDERPVHTVYVSSFYMEIYELSNAQMRDILQWGYNNTKIYVSTTYVYATGGAGALMRVNSASWNDILYAGGTFSVASGKDAFPVGAMNWWGALFLCNLRSMKEGLEPCYDVSSNNHFDWTCNWSKNGYRLPTEAEWEKAARGGLNGHHFPWSSPLGIWSEHIDGSKANYFDSGDPYDNAATPTGYFNGSQTPSGLAMSNGYGLYDMAGNMKEKCWDWEHSDWYSDPAASNADTKGRSTNPFSNARLVRGGSYKYIPSYGRCSSRDGKYHDQCDADVGMRCARNF